MSKWVTLFGSGKEGTVGEVDNPVGAERLGIRAALVIIAFGATMLGIHLGRARALTFHEVIFAQPAREMIRTGDWTMTRFAGVTSTHKPPVTHWAIALSMSIFDSEAEWVCRLPILLATLATALIVAALAARWHGRRVGLITGLVQLTSFYILMQGRLAESDMVLTMNVTAAMALFALGNIRTEADRPPSRLVTWGFFAVCGLAFMTKFAIGPAFIFSGCGLYVLIERPRGAVKFLLNPIGWLIFFALTVPWMVTAYYQYPPILDDWLMHNVGRFAGKMGTGRDDWLFYFYTAPAIAMPWTVWVICSLPTARRQRIWRCRHWRFLAAWFLAGLTLLTLSSWKAKHYLIPIMPPLSILAGWFLDHDTFKEKGLRLRPIPVAIIVVAAYVATVLAIRHSKPVILPQVAVLAAILGVLLVVAAALHCKRRGAARLAVLFAACWITSVTAQVFIMKHFDSYRPQANFAAEINAKTPSDERLYFVSLPENQTAYYLRFPLARFDSIGQLVQHVKTEAPRDLYIITADGDVPSIKALGQVENLADCPKRRPTAKRRRLVLLRLRPDNTNSQ